MGQYTGDLTTWKSFGDFQNKLNEGRGELPEATKAKIKSLVSGIEDPQEKIRKVYTYLQENTRYVSVQLGIGGWQPFEAKFVDDKGYGDCKALTNYTKSLLKEIGIESYYTLVYVGDRVRDILPDFAASQFNHVILAVPTPQDTIWLECTSQSQAFDYMSDFTGNREALLVTPEGGKVVQTPSYHENENLLLRKAWIKLDEEGNASFDVKTCYQALQEGSRDYIVEIASQDQKKWLYKSIDLPSFEIDDFSLVREKESLPKTWESLKLSVRKYASKNGKRIFLPVNPLNKISPLRSEDNDRKTPVFIQTGFTDKDSIDFVFPQDFRVEYQPEDIEITSDFGSYKATFSKEEGQMKYYRYLQLKHGTYPKEKYPELVKFFKAISKADK
ncbi:MAG: transglutaminase domain-containing protein, partial [Bacteroidota bacterium]